MAENIETRISSEQAKEAIYQAHLSKDAIAKIEGLSSSASEIDKSIIRLDTLSDLRSLTSQRETVYVSGYYNKNDGAFGEHIFTWDSTSVEIDNGGTIIKCSSIATGRYKLKFNGEFVESGWFGNTEADLRTLLASSIANIKISADYTITSPLISNLARRKIDGNGKTITLSSGTSAGTILYIRGEFTHVFDININGNKLNTINGSVYDSTGISISKDDVIISKCNIYDVYGIGIRGIGSRNIFFNNRIINVMGYGIFMDAESNVIYTNNIAKNNFIDIRNGNPSFTQGILFTSKLGTSLSDQLNWEITGNTVYGVDSSLCNDQAICLAVRGNYGLCSGNTTMYGSMGFSEGGIGTIINNNKFLELRGSMRFGIEPSHTHQVITNNTVTNAKNGISASGSFSGMIISNNNFECTGSGIKMQSTIGETNSSIIISGNTIKSPSYCIEIIRSVQDININNNIIEGPGITAGRGVFIDSGDTSMNLSIRSNIFIGVQRHVAIYNNTATPIGGIYLTDNIGKNAIGTNRIFTEGSAIVGTDVSGIGNFTTGLGRSMIENVLDQKNNIIDSISSSVNNPEGVMTAGIGSTHRSKNNTGGSYFKLSGTGNTGWVKSYASGPSGSFTTSDGKTVTVVGGVISTIA